MNLLQSRTVVCFVDNDINSSRDTIGIKDLRGGETGVHIPKVASKCSIIMLFMAG